VSDTAGLVTVTAPAKINVHLAVGGLRPDGFHDLSTVFHAIDLHDTVLAAPASGLALRLDGPEAAGLRSDHTNLAWRAAALLAEHAGIAPDAAVTVRKTIPIAAGLAGGSADAAGTLRACAELWRLGIGASELALLAEQLGSDVSFALQGRTALGTGRGEQLQQVQVRANWHWVVAAADGQLATPAVYAELDRQRAADGATRTLGDPSALIEAFGRGDLEAVAGLLGNDLQPAALALAPYLRNTLQAGADVGALAGIVSGSGPSCVFLARNAVHATEVAAALQKTQTCRLAFAVRGDVAGAQVRLREDSVQQ
jgi:4-diphosphocytidyl-2-C-methyl-D-erythritol kinase